MRPEDTMTTRTPREGAVWDDSRCAELDTLGLR